MNNLKAKQSTLFQSWGSFGTDNKITTLNDGCGGVGKTTKNKSNSSMTNHIDLTSCSDDEELFRAIEESLLPQNQVSASSSISHPTHSSSKGFDGFDENKQEQYANFDIGWESDLDDEEISELCETMETASTDSLTSHLQNNLPENNLNKYDNLKSNQCSLNFSMISTSALNENKLLMTTNPNIRAIENNVIQSTPSICLGFDSECGFSWIYPSNRPIRDYQFSIVQKALFNNTLVCLPTGLGKTFVAAVVMFNFYRWYPTGKVVFMAPTKPLVAQQIEACHSVMGIPMEVTAEMTGAMQPEERRKTWKSHRAFYLTPQVMMNDLQRGACPALEVKCLVIDEAHKALGNHSYCQVVKELSRSGCEFRIVALSATPGSDIKSVQQVISNLLISHIELRTEESIDIQPYTHQRNVEKVVIPLGQEVTKAMDQYLRVVGDVVQRLRRFGVMYQKDLKNISKFNILQARETFRKDPPQNINQMQKGLIEGDFAMCISLYHGYELLQQHGLRSLYSFLQGIIGSSCAATNNNASSTGFTPFNAKMRSELLGNPEFERLYESLEKDFEPIKHANPNLLTQQTQGAAKPPLVFGHPKMKKLVEIVLEHFNKFTKDGLETRVMIFSSYRDSVNEITQLLNIHRPKIKAMSFIGHSSSGGGAKGFNQKDQLKVMQKFREGGYNTLVSTCIGEEGLDIGEVDLIICFDAHKSPIRLVQRMGRTGRKRQGRVVMLVAEGKEEKVYNTSQSNRNSIVKLIQNKNGRLKLQLNPNNPRMVPANIEPTCQKLFMEVPVFQLPKSKNRNSSSGATALPGAYSRPKSKGGKEVVVTREMMERWKQGCLNADGSPKFDFPQSRMLTLSSHAFDSSCLNGPNTYMVSVSKHPTNQVELQEFSTVSHSLESRNYVELMEFISVLGNSTSGLYETEMKLFLNEEDLNSNNNNKNNKTKHGSKKITRSIADGTLDQYIEKPKRGRKRTLADPKQKSKKKGSAVDTISVVDSEDTNSRAFIDLEDTNSNVFPAIEKDVVVKNTELSKNQIGNNDNMGEDDRDGPFSSFRRKQKSKSSSKESVVVEIENDFKTGDLTEFIIKPQITDSKSSFTGIPLKESNMDGDVIILDSEAMNPVEPNDGSEMNCDKDEVFRVPTPPSVDDIPRLLDELEVIFKEKQHKKVDIVSIFQNCCIKNAGVFDTTFGINEKKTKLHRSDVGTSCNKFPPDSTFQQFDFPESSALDENKQRSKLAAYEAERPKEANNSFKLAKDESIHGQTSNQHCKEVQITLSSSPLERSFQAEPQDLDPWSQASCVVTFVPDTEQWTVKDRDFDGTQPVAARKEDNIEGEDACEKLDIVKDCSNEINSSFHDDIIPPSPPPSTARRVRWFHGLSSRVNFSSMDSISDSSNRNLKLEERECKNVCSAPVIDESYHSHHTAKENGNNSETLSAIQFDSSKDVTKEDLKEAAICSQLLGSDEDDWGNEHGDFTTFADEFVKSFFSDDEEVNEDELENDVHCEEKNKYEFNKSNSLHMKNEPVVSHCPTSMSSMSSFSTIPHKSREALKRLRATIADTSQVTYTQALECLQYSNIFDETNSEQFSIKQFQPGSDSGNHISVPAKSFLVDDSEQNRSVRNVDPENIVVPELDDKEAPVSNFDLGFDLDEWSDEDSNEPSLPKKRKLDISVSQSDGSKEKNIKNIPKSVLSSEFSSKINLSEHPTSLLRNSKLGEKSNFTVIKPTDTVDFSPLKPSDDNDDDYIDDQILGSIDIKSASCINNCAGDDNDSIKECEVPKTAELRQPACSSTPNLNFKKGSKIFCSTPVDSPIIQLHKKNLRNAILSDSDESPIFADRKRKLQKLEVPQTKHSDDDFEDFKGVTPTQMLNAVVKKNRQKSNRKLFPDNLKIKNQKVKQKLAGAEYLDEEAEVSLDHGEVSSDENLDDDNADCYEGSFIDNSTENLDSVDQHAFYMRLNRARPSQSQHYMARFKLKYPTETDAPLDVFSQEDEDGSCENEYEEDSFCVGSAVAEECENNDEYEEEFEPEDYTQLQKDAHKHRKRYRNRSGENNRKKKRKRVIVNDSTHDDTWINQGGDDNDCSVEAIGDNKVEKRHRDGKVRYCNVIDDDDEEEEDGNVAVVGNSPNKANDNQLENNRRPKVFCSVDVSPQQENKDLQTHTSEVYDVINKSDNRTSDMSPLRQLQVTSPQFKSPSMISKNKSRLACKSKLNQLSSPTSDVINLTGRNVSDTYYNDTSKIDVRGNNHHIPNIESTKTISSDEFDGNVSRLRNQQRKTESINSPVENISHVNNSTNLHVKNSSLYNNVSYINNSSITTSKSSPSFSISMTVSPVLTTPALNSKHKSSLKPVILVNSQHISSAQNVLSCLRFNHKIDVVVKSFGGCNFIVSSRMAVNRMYLSDFTSFSNKAKILDSLRLMSEKYERTALIVEKDSGKNVDSTGISLMKTKNSTHLVACLSLSSTRLWFSDSQEHTAQILSDLQRGEQIKGFNINIDSSSLQNVEHILQFYASIPKLPYVNACCLAVNIPTIEEFINSSVELLTKAGCMSKDRATEVHEYIRHQFNQQMITLRGQKLS